MHCRSLGSTSSYSRSYVYVFYGFQSKRIQASGRAGLFIVTTKAIYFILTGFFRARDDLGKGAIIIMLCEDKTFYSRLRVVTAYETLSDRVINQNNPGIVRAGENILRLPENSEFQGLSSF